jgi:putative membrane protein
MAALFAFLHLIAAFTPFAAPVVELILICDELAPARARKILLAGMNPWCVGRRAARFYFHTWTFIAKLTLFFIVALLSIVPTIEFLSWRAPVRQAQPPHVAAPQLRSLGTIIHLELLVVVLIILMAAMMAKGVGLML